MARRHSRFHEPTTPGPLPKLLVIASIALAPDARADVYANGSFRWIQGVEGAALHHYGNTSDVAIGYVRSNEHLEWLAGGLVEGWFGHAPFGMGPGAANAYVSPGVEAGVTWRDGAWQIGPRIAVAAPDAPSPDDRGGTSVAFGIGFRLR
jgi:hypothetical protein